MLRRSAIAGILLITALVLSYKVAYWTMGSFALSKYRALTRHEIHATNPEETERRSQLLNQSVRMMPHNDFALREFARFAMSEANDENEENQKTALRILGQGILGNDGRLDTDNPRAGLLYLASKAYGEAMKANRLDCHSMFWGAVVGLDYLKTLGKPDSRESIHENFAQMNAALKCDPLQADRFFTAGKMALEYGRTDEAIELLRKTVELRPNYFSKSAKLVHFSEVGLQGVRNLMKNDQDGLLTKEYYLYLMDHWHFNEAYKAFLDYRNEKGLQTSRRDAALVANGSFSHDLGGVFHDWVIQNVHGVDVKLERRGAKSYASVEMNNGPANYFHLFQDVPVEPGARYILKAKIRVRGFSDETRIGIEVIHPMSPALFTAQDECYVSTYMRASNEKTCRTHFDEFETEFTVPETLPVVRIRLRRQASAAELSSGKGAIDLTDVSLTKLEPVSSEEKAE